MPKSTTPTVNDKTAELSKQPSLDEKTTTVASQTAEKKAEKDDFTVQIKKYGRIRGIGIKTMATMANIPEKAGKLWLDFVPRMDEVTGAYPGTIGVNVMITENAEDPYQYWAVKPVTNEEAIPAGMEEVVVEGQTYVQVNTKVDQLGEAYAYVYGEWAKKNPEHKLSWTLPTWEFYPPSYMETKEVTLCMALEKKT
ncbi:hypothetical protein BLNAU_13820 [Blattamonas nauphoetae]|uniref:AraC effector-binding domain-containing protein n=1 Tax=Blattamonas nauphoetae TaxID=2049346 RepID=A0ABQ9XK48_9EUKA|nr:hypothetical protein BLNAU_13820 [Blattamonas nauphoetae]